MTREYRTKKMPSAPHEEYAITKILVQTGDRVEIEQDLYEVSTSKAIDVQAAEQAGIVAEIFVKEGQQDIPQDFLIMTIHETVEVHEPDAKISKFAPLPEVFEENPVEKSAVQTRSASLPEPRLPLPVTPVAQAIADFFKIDISGLEVPAGCVRVSSMHVLNFVKNRLDIPPIGAMPIPVPDFSTFGPTETIPLNTIGKSTARHLSKVWMTVPHAWMLEKADITELESHRLAAKQQMQNLSWTAIYVKAVVGVLKQFPRCNASFDAAGEQIILKKYYHIGVAVDTPKGLVVPVVRDADRKSLAEIATQLGDFAKRAKGEGHGFSQGDFDGHTFSISNVGMLGATGILPIVHAPDSAILGLTAAKKEVVWDERTQQPVPRLMLSLTLGFDHRLVNGAEAANFLAALKKSLEGPILNML